MTENFILSEKRVKKVLSEDFYLEKDVKQAVKLLKEDLARQLDNEDLLWAEIRINKIFGEKLI